LSAKPFRNIICRDTARIWDAASTKAIAALLGHDNDVKSAAFSPDGSRIVTASEDTTARIWDAGSGKEIAVLRGHEGPVLSAAFSPDGTRIVTASVDRTARIWDAASAKQIAVLRGQDGFVYSAAISPNGSRIVTASWDNTARIWDAASAKEIAVLRGHEGTVVSAAFSPDGSRIVTASSESASCGEIAGRMRCEVVKAYKDHGISGARGRDRRPAFDAPCRDATKRQFDMVMAWSVDRLGRSLEDLVAFMALRGPGLRASASVGLCSRTGKTDQGGPGQAGAHGGRSQNRGAVWR
jgi:predicted NACHT family NTPase